VRHKHQLSSGGKVRWLEDHDKQPEAQNALKAEHREAQNFLHVGSYACSIAGREPASAGGESASNSGAVGIS